jgi:hypothetical protein
VVRLSAVQGLGVNSAQQAIAEIGPAAASFDSPQELASWVGGAGARGVRRSIQEQSQSQGQPHYAAHAESVNAARKTKGSVFQILYRRWLPKLGHKRDIWALTHSFCGLTWIILHRGEEYIEHGKERDVLAGEPALLARQLRRLGYQVIPPKDKVVA